MIIPKLKNRKLQICVIGDSSCNSDQESVAYELGEEIAKVDAVLICGGRGGIMKFVAKGVFDNNGISIGILPTADGHDANEYLSVVIPTNMGWTRNALVTMASDVIIVLGGKVGTLNEMSFGWMWGKPIISIVDERFNHNSWGIKLAGQKIDDRRSDYIYPVKNPKEAIKLALELVNNLEKSQFPEKSG